MNIGSEYDTNIDENDNNKNNSQENENNQTESEKNSSIDNKNNINEVQITNNNSINQNTTHTNLTESIENNNIINNNINNNLENNDNNISNNIENNYQINNDSINNIPEEEEIEIYNPKFTFSFKLFFILSTLAYIHSYYKSFDFKNYTLCLYPIFIKNQYYRLISSHFYYLNFFDYFSSMIGLFFATKYLEREIGSIYTILIIFHGIILTSILYILAMWLFKTLFRFSEYNFIYQSGFTSIDFCLYLSYFLLKKNYRRNINFAFIDFRGVHSVYFVILLFQLISPSASIVLNICGTFSAFLIFKFFKYFSLPRNYWISDMEKIFGLNKLKNCEIKYFFGYFSINENDTVTNNVKEFDYFLNNVNKKKEIINNKIKNPSNPRNS